MHLPPALSVCTVVLSFCDGLMLSAISAPEQPAKLNTNDKTRINADSTLHRRLFDVLIFSLLDNILFNITSQ